ncbi:ribonuclease H [Acrasis kona]|uniref:ribonuclease H n=1 Tax=Acrasis kona TaxID=1008807 RepID=A0AAW2ZK56_9EUKA
MYSFGFQSLLLNTASREIGRHINPAKGHFSSVLKLWKGLDQLKTEQFTRCKQKIFVSKSFNATDQETLDPITNTENVKSDINGSVNESTIVYTDGSCLDNGQPNARAGIGVFFGTNDPRNVSEILPGIATNNRAELSAAIRALEIIPHGDIEIRTDSNYLITGITIYIKKWKTNNFKTYSNKPVKNDDLFKKLDYLISSRTGAVKWTLIEAHSGDFGNTQADILAVEGSKLNPV